MPRHIGAPGPFMTLCLTEPEYLKVMRYLKVKGPPEWVSPGAHATTHFLHNDEHEKVSVVCMKDWLGRDPIDVATLLVHEAVHIWQYWCEKIGEDRPGDEQEAYAIQLLSYTLMREFVRKTQ